MQKSLDSSDLDSRAQQLLKVLIERYIEDGLPVGSRTLARASGLDLSPATIRNIMADLEDMGLLRSPHTSAGRVPTVEGYRLFVDSLLQVKELQPGEIQVFKQQLSADGDEQSLLASASSLLSGITHLAGVVSLPRREQQAIRHIEFLPLSERRVLAIIVVNAGEVLNRILRCERDYDVNELQQVANYLNQHYAGEDLTRVRERLLTELDAVRDSVNRLMHAAIEMMQQLRTDTRREDLVMAGESNLIGFEELADLPRLRQLFEAFYEKRGILHLLDRCIGAEGVQIFIGSESGFEVLDHCSVVTAPYSIDGQVVGVLGVIGPTRMSYDRVIPVVDVTARLLGAALNPHH
jgi:heat-inducible transcriptional repressor